MRYSSVDALPGGPVSFLQQQAAHLEAEAYRIEYPENKYTSFVPLDNSAPDWAEVVQFSTVDSRGEPEIMGPNSTDFPTADISMGQGWHPIKTIGLGYTFSLQELNFAYLNNVNLDAERVRAVRDLTEQGLNQIYLLGDKEIGEGLYNSGNVNVITAPGKLDSLVADGNAQGVLDLFGDLYNQVYVKNTRTIHRPTHFLLPPSVMQVLRRSILNSANASNFTYLTFLEQNFGDMTFDEDIFLEDAGANGSRRIVCFKYDMRVVKGHDVMSQRFEAPATADNWNFRVPSYARTGGTEWRIPSAGQYMDGV